MRDVVATRDMTYATRLPWFFLFLAASAVVAALVAQYVSEPANRRVRSGLWSKDEKKPAEAG